MSGQESADEPATVTWEDGVDVRVGAAELWELLWRAEGQAAWLGRGSAVHVRRRTRSVLVDEAGPWRVARCRGVHPGRQVTFDVDPAVSWPPGTAPSELTIRVSGDEHEAELTVEEHGLDPATLTDVERYWTERLRLVEDLARRVRRRRRDVRQAVVVIHGIGEQRPGATLEALVASGVLGAGGADDEDEDTRAWVKPDRWSGSFELRRVTTKGDDATPPTDAYELYWAHLVRDTTLGQVGSWFGQLLLRWPVPRPLLPQWLGAWAVLVAVAVAVVVSPALPVVGASVGALALLGVAARALWRVVGRSLATQVVGDAARYLRPRPENVAHRQAIREAGVELLERLHDAGHYDRIVVLGHSLGSVVAYDVITHLWIARHRRHRRPSTPAFAALREIERAITDGVPAGSSPRELQHEAWCQSRVNTQPWLVTDLVTVGSPLTYAEFLMADDRDDLERAKRDRVMPTCPPVTEVERGSGHHRITFDRPYGDRLDGVARRTFTVAHHGAPFAVTRWTNLYFRQRHLGLSGDIVGGPVAPQFGEWVDDVELRSPWRTFAHTRYWAPSQDDDRHLTALRDALGLAARLELHDLAARIPAFALLPEARERRRADGVDP